MVQPTFNTQIWYKVQESLSYMMGPFLVVCDTLMGPLWTAESASLIFDTFVTV